MFLSNINWRHIVGALVTGLVLHVAGFLNFWLFLALVALGIILALIQYLPVGRRVATWLIMSWIIFFIVIPGAHRAIMGHWPLTAKALENQNRASDLKSAESLHQPGLLGVASQRNLANAKERTREQMAQDWFAAAEKYAKANDWDNAAKAEKNGRDILNRAIETRETDSEYIREKLRSVKAPDSWWESIKDFFTDTDFAGLWSWTNKQGFSLRLLILGVVLLLLGALVLRRLSKGFGGAVVVAGCVALVWALFLFITPELAPNPAASQVSRAATHAAAPQTPKTFNVPAGKTIATGIFLKAGQIARFHQPSPQLFYLKGDQKDIPVRSTDWTDQWRSPGQIGLRGGPQPTTVTVIVGG